MKRLLLTLNLGNWLCDNARESHEAAAKRWRCDYLMATEAYLPDHAPSFNKFPYLADKAWDEICYLDADILVRSNAPSPFPLRGGAKVAAVRDIQAHHPKEMQELVLANVHKCYHQQVGYYDTPFNSGFLVIRPSSMFARFYLQEVVELKPELARNGHYEQALFNSWMAGGGLVLLPDTWNLIFPPVEDPVMHAFCYHFTGMGFDGRRDLLKTYNWRV